MNRIFKLLVVVLTLARSCAFAQCPENIGFEDGTFKNWQCYAGEVLDSGAISVNLSGPVYDRHTIIAAESQTLDYYGKFPTVSPNGSKYSVRLGNMDTVHQAERLSYTFVVPQGAEYGLVLNYAVVLQNPNHPEKLQPRFTVKVFNVTDNKDVECPAFNFIASSNLPGFKLSDIRTTGMAAADIYYKDWSSTTINLVGYEGKTIRLEFTTNDCAQRRHFGYAYFDINESCKNTITGNTYCIGQTSVTLHGPRGFSKYKWTMDGDTTTIGRAQNLELKPAPPDGTRFALEISALKGLGCPDVLHTVIQQVGKVFNFKVAKPVIWICPGTSANLNDPAVTAGSDGDLTYNYYRDAVNLAYLRNPQSVAQAGIYYIEAINPEGCSNVLPVEVKFYDDPTVKINYSPVVTYPATVDISAAFTHVDGYQYTYFRDVKATVPLTDYDHLNKSAKYYIKSISPDGCSAISLINVTINPPPPNVIEGPTAFTPNNDGINDKFMISVKGFVDFGSLSVYNRYGQFMFKTKSQSDFWDGSFQGKTLPVGTYYWLFEGMDQYWHTAIKKGGYVTIVR